TRDACEAWLVSHAGAAAPGSWQDREQAARPALAELAWAAAGELLGQQDRGSAPAVPRLAPPLLHSDALSFVTVQGRPWICTCGATVFSPPAVVEDVADVVQPQVAESQQLPSEESPRAPPTLSPLSPPSSPSLVGGEEVLEFEVEEDILGPSSVRGEADLQGADEASVPPLLAAHPGGLPTTATEASSRVDPAWAPDLTPFLQIARCPLSLLVVVVVVVVLLLLLLLLLSTRVWG
ncbi:unnamed protein product, partial [Prorocentrum cordatum]